MNKKSKTILIIIFSVLTQSETIYAEENNQKPQCLSMFKDHCVTFGGLLVKSMSDMIKNTPNAMKDIYNSTKDELNKQNEVQAGKSMKECMKDKKVIDNETIRCRYGYLMNQPH